MKIKIRLILYFVLLAVAVYLMFLLFNLNKKPGVVLPRDFPEIIASGTLNVATDYNTIGYHVSGDTTAGFQYELIKSIEKAWAIEVKIFLENNLENNLNGLKTGKYDVVARNIPINSELLSEFDFTRFISRNKQVLVQRKHEYNDSIEPIRQHLELAKKTIHVPHDSPAILRIRNLAHEIGDTIFIVENATYESEQLVMMVAGGDIDFAVCDEKTAMKLAQEFPEIDIQTDISFTQLESWAVRKDSPILLDSLNSWFGSFLESKEFGKLYKRYYD